MRARRLRMCDSIELISAVIAVMSAVAVALDLFIPSYAFDELSFKFVLLLVVALFPSVMFGAATLLHLRTHRRSALLGMGVVGSINNSLIAMPAVGLIYLLASHQITEGLVFLLLNFFSVLITLAAALIGNCPVRVTPQPVN